MSLLIVDDIPSQRILLKAILNTNGYKDIQLAASAQDVFKQLGIDNPEQPLTNINLIIMDINMADINGIEACHKIKAIPQLQDIPIIIMTGTPDEEKLQQAYQAGATDYLAKPINKFELLSRVQSALRLKQEIDQRKQCKEELKLLKENLKTT